MLFLYVELDGSVTHNGEVMAYHVTTQDDAITEALTNVQALLGKWGEYEVIDYASGATLREGFLRRG